MGNVHNGKINKLDLDGKGDAYDKSSLLPATCTGIIERPTWSFTGQFVNGKRHGKGCVKYCNGVILNNIYQDGELVSSEVSYYDEHAVVFHENNMNKGITCESCIIISDDLSIYNGEFVDGRLHGDGSFYSVNGDWKDGTFIRGEFVEGKSYIKSVDAKHIIIDVELNNIDAKYSMVETGRFEYNLLHGKGTIQYINNNIPILEVKGKFLYGKPDGNVTITLNNITRIETYDNGVKVHNDEKKWLTS